MAAGKFDSLDTAAMPFVTVGDDDKFEVNPEAVRYLKTLTGKVAVVSIAGIYRTGKSYLLNQLMGKSGAFSVGSTVKACTKGIWLWGKAIEIDGSDVHVLFLDTEGLGSTVRSETYDCRIFALALLLSSYFIYNSFGTVDGNAIAKLSLVVNLTKHIHVRSAVAGKEDSGTEFNQFFPHFLWVVRDFSVKLEKDGRKISAREYLEDALRPEEGVTEAVEQKNAVRMLIRNFFPERDCVTMVRPVSDEKQLMNLTAVAPEALRPEFRAQIDAMRRRLLSTVRPKTLYGKPLNGAMLGSLAEAYCAALNAGSTPTISTAWDRVVDSQCQEAVEVALRTYVGSMHDKLAAASAAAAAAKAAAMVAGAGDGLSPAVGAAAGAGATGLATPATATASAGGSGILPLATRAGHGASARYAEESTIVEEEDMVAAHAASVALAEALFAERAVQDSDKSPPYEAEMKAQIQQAYERLRRANEAASGAFCLELLDRLHGSATARLHAMKKGAAVGAGAEAAAVPSSLHALAVSSGPMSAKSARGSSSSSSSPSAASARGLSADAAAAEDASGVTAPVSSAASAVLPAAAVAKEYRAACESVAALYAREARGPARYRVLSEFLTDRLPPLLVEAAMTSDDSRGAEAGAYRARLAELSQQLVAARGRERVAQETLAGERRSFEAALADASRRAGEREEALRSNLDARGAELERLQGRFDRMLASSEAASVRADETIARMQAELAATHARVDALQSARLTAVMDMNMLSQRLAEAEAARGDAQRLAAELRLKVAEEAKSAAVLLERCRAAENETVRLREGTDLLYESVRVQKDLLAAKHDEKEEVEYQWGVAKGKLAQMESEKSELQAELNVVSSVATQLKLHMLKQGKAAMKGLTLDRLEQRAFDSLGGAAT